MMHCLPFTRLVLLVTLSSVIFAESLYTPQLDFAVKKGNKRNIARLSLVMPLYQKEDRVLYGNIITMADTKRAREGNFGVGYRQLFDESYILGTFVHYDLRQTPNKNKVSQLTLGAEYLEQDFELRANVYLPFKKRYHLGSGTQQTIHRLHGSRIRLIQQGVNYQEDVQTGFDVEMGHDVFSDKLTGYVGYYHFQGHSHMNGVRARVDYRIHDNITLEGEYSYDNQRYGNYFLGARFSWKLGEKENKLTRLQRKMTQMPVRDIDVVVKKILVENGEASVQVEGFAVKNASDLKQIGQGIHPSYQENWAIDSTYVIVNDISLVSESWEPLDFFSGKLYGLGHVISGLNIYDTHDTRGGSYGRNMNGAGLFREAENALIDGVRLKRVSVVSFREHVGALVGYAKDTVIRDCYVSGTLTHISSGPGVNRNIGGLIGAGEVVDFDNCHAKVNLNANSAAAGGLAGELQKKKTRDAQSGKGGKITKSSACVNIHSDGTAGAGGLVGYASEVDAEDCYTKGKIKVALTRDKQNSTYVGGLFGVLQGPPKTPVEAAADGLQSTVTAVSRNSAHVNIEAPLTSMVGGLIGSVTNAQITYGVNTGSILGRKSVGGIVGYAIDVDMAYVSNHALFIHGADKVGGFIGKAQNTQLEQGFNATADVSASNGIAGMMIGDYEYSISKDGYANVLRRGDSQLKLKQAYSVPSKSGQVSDFGSLASTQGVDVVLTNFGILRDPATDFSDKTIYGGAAFDFDQNWQMVKGFPQVKFKRLAWAFSPQILAKINKPRAMPSEITEISQSILAYAKPVLTPAEETHRASQALQTVFNSRPGFSLDEVTMQRFLGIFQFRGHDIIAAKMVPHFENVLNDMVDDDGNDA